MAKWFVYAKKADFKAIGEAYGIDQVIARVIRNRDICTKEQFDMYLSDSLEGMHMPELLKDADKAVDIIINKIEQKKKIRIIGDYDIDGICSTTILYKALKETGAEVDYAVPHRINDGYGINETLIDAAIADGVDTILTCDNGIAAINQVEYAKSHNLTVIITDHHDITFEENGTQKRYIYPKADAIVNPKRDDCGYPFKMLCGAAVAYKLVEVLYKKRWLSEYDKYKSSLDEYRQFAAIATIGDVVDLIDENRILVKNGLRSIANTKNIGLRALIDICKIDINKLTPYSVGFVIGPCLNASGRLDTAKNAIELFLETDENTAKSKAMELYAFNEERKGMTESELSKALKIIDETEIKNDKVLVIYLPDCHESIAGIIAGRIKELYYRPTFVITDAKDGAKGSGRSIEGYNMFEEITKCAGLLTKFGGHPMAAGISLDKDKIDEFRKRLNKNQTLTEQQLEPVVWIDVPMPLNYVTYTLVEQLSILEPFGKGNEKPVFADKDLIVKSVNIIGKKSNVLKLMLEAQDGSVFEAIQFMYDGNKPQVGQKIAITYYPDINEFRGKRNLQFIIKEWKQN
ncbi:MAG: single-stranded-DNA-specific exonuclease RecJ [Lachnospira sp.]